MANGQDGIYADDECRCDDPLNLFYCNMHDHWSNHDWKCLGRCYTKWPASRHAVRPKHHTPPRAGSEDP